MKKINSILFIAVITLFSSLAHSQSKGQISALQDIGEKSVFKNYWGIKTEAGKTTGSISYAQFEIVFVNNVNGKISAFEMNEVGTNDTKSNSGFGWLEPNHYTEPSLFSGNRKAYVYIDGLIYGLQDIKDPNDVTSFTMDEIYVLMKPTQGEHTSGKTAAKEMKTRDHKAVIKQYLAEMKAIQEKATANFSTEIKNEIVILEQAKIDEAAGVQAKNAAYWNSEEGQRVLNKSNQAKVTIINDTEGDFGICYGSGVSRTLKPGEKIELGCSAGNINEGEKIPNNSANLKSGRLLINLSGQNCGKQINASSL